MHEDGTKRGVWVVEFFVRCRIGMTSVKTEATVPKQIRVRGERSQQANTYRWGIESLHLRISRMRQVLALSLCRGKLNRHPLVRVSCVQQSR